MTGIKETTEALVAFNEVTLFLVTIFKDGIDLEDFGAIWDKLTEDEEFKTLMNKAFEGIGQIPREVEDLDFREGVSLSKIQLDFLPKILDVIKSK